MNEEDPKRPPILVDPDLPDVVTSVVPLLAACLARSVPRSTVDPILEESLSRLQKDESLSRRQRLLIWQMTHLILDRAYKLVEDEYGTS